MSGKQEEKKRPSSVIGDNSMLFNELNSKMKAGGTLRSVKPIPSESVDNSDLRKTNSAGPPSLPTKPGGSNPNLSTPPPLPSKPKELKPSGNSNTSNVRELPPPPLPTKPQELTKPPPPTPPPTKPETSPSLKPPLRPPPKPKDDFSSEDDNNNNSSSSSNNSNNSNSGISSSGGPKRAAPPPIPPVRQSMVNMSAVKQPNKIIIPMGLQGFVHPTSGNKEKHLSSSSLSGSGGGGGGGGGSGSGEKGEIITVAFSDLQTSFSIQIFPNSTTSRAAREMVISKMLKKMPNVTPDMLSKYDSQYFFRIESDGSHHQIGDSDLLSTGKVFVFGKKELMDNLHKKSQSTRFASLRVGRSAADIDPMTQSFVLQFVKKYTSSPSSDSNNSTSSSSSSSSSSSQSSSSSGSGSSSNLPIPSHNNNSNPSLPSLPSPLSSSSSGSSSNIGSVLSGSGSGSGDRLSSPSLNVESPPPKESQEEKVDNPISELLSTERSFIYDLDLMLQHFVKELTEKNILPSKNVGDMFLNIENISKLHKEIYRRLSLDSSVGGISDIFGADLVQEIERVYTIYLGHYEQALALFYSLREKSSNFIKFLARINEDPLFKDKSLTNLLVVPMQRVCKYELLLNSIASKERKRNSRLPNPDPVLEDNIKRLLVNAELLNAVLLKIDQKRSEADKWATLIKLEEKLSTSEPLRKRGRYIAREAELTVVNLLNSDELQRCYVVLFNDIFLRAKLSKNNNRVLEMTPLRLYILFDKQCQFCSDNCINIASLDPRGHVLRIELPDKKEKEKWTQSFENLTSKQERLSKQWNMPNDIELGTLLAADKCQWDAAYVQHCRLFITSRHLLLAWEAFGSWEREHIPLREIQSATITSDDKLQLNTSGWKATYTFSGLRRLKHTHEILETAMLEQAVREAKGVSIKGFEKPVAEEIAEPQDSSYSPCCDLLFLKLSDEEASKIWNGEEIAYKAGDVILSHDSKSSHLFQVVTGSVKMMRREGDKVLRVLTAGEYFGLPNFLTASPSLVNFVGGEEGASVFTISRPVLLQHLKDEQVLLAKFFSLLACKMTDDYSLIQKA